MSDIPTADEVRDQALRDAIHVLLAQCTEKQRAALHAIHDRAPWKGLFNCPADKLRETYNLVRRTVEANG